MNKPDKPQPATVVNSSGRVDVRAVRRARGMTQQVFADTFGFTIGALRDWEQGRKRPERSARILLEVIRSAPETVAKAVAEAGSAIRSRRPVIARPIRSSTRPISVCRRCASGCSSSRSPTPWESIRASDPTHFLKLPQGYESSRRVALKHVEEGSRHFHNVHKPSNELPRAVGVRAALADLPRITEHRTEARTAQAIANADRPYRQGHLFPYPLRQLPSPDDLCPGGGQAPVLPGRFPFRRRHERSLPAGRKRGSAAAWSGNRQGAQATD